VCAVAAAGALELLNDSEWVYQISFVGPLPLEADLRAQAKHLPSNALRFSYQTTNTDFLGNPGITRKYVGFYDPACQKPIDIRRKACAKIGYPLFSTGSELHCSEFFSLEPSAPADQCVLLGYSDHYLRRVTNTNWQLNRLFGSGWFLIPAALATAGFLNLFLMRLLWFPIWRWIMS
jgi:hypothetical protein